jgi:hypothetical protein
MSVAMTLPPLYTFMTWTGTNLVLLTVKILKLQVLTVLTGSGGLVTDRSLVHNYY